MDNPKSGTGIYFDFNQDSTGGLDRFRELLWVRERYLDNWHCVAEDPASDSDLEHLLTIIGK